MIQYFTHYTKWEDWQNGMYMDVPKSDIDRQVKLSIDCLRDPENAMLSVVCDWPHSTKENLTDRKTNRKSWLGQAACCYQYGCAESATRKAWSLLTKEEREKANQIAQNVIELWESYYLENQF